jgi:predicted metal-dependent enzyme (double-stranded beta helix superfamily)
VTVPPPSTPAAGYGARAGLRAPLARFAAEVERIVEACEGEEVPRRVREALGPLLRQPDLLAPEHRAPAEGTYRRHVLYADPGGRFTILALVWKPGQTTPVHGHSAWGAVGVYEGTPNVALYACATAADGHIEARLVRDLRCAPGETSAVLPGYDDAHRIYNGSDAMVVTLHVYGRDLVAAPESINLVV